MDIVERLRRFIFLAALCLCGDAFSFTYTISSHGVTGTGGSPAEAADRWASAYNSLGRVSCYNGSTPSSYWNVVVGRETMGLPGIDYSGRTIGIIVYPTTAACNQSSIPDRVAFTFTGTNTCQVPDSLVVACQPNADQVCSQLGDLGSSSSKWLYKGNSLSTCRGDCVFIPESSGYDKTTGYTIAWGKLINQGLSCGSTADTESKGYSDSDPDKPADAPHAGEKGYCPGTYNGATIWVKCSSTNETTKTDNTTTKTETNGGSSTTGTTTTSTTSKTSCDGSNCTTTTTTTMTNPDGTKTDKSETTSQAQADYCTRNPNATACKRPEGSFGGSCTAGFSCEGDAVQCAIAREAYRRNCELLEKETPESTLGKSIAKGEDRPVGHPGNSPDVVNVSGSINQTNPYGGSCPPDINLNVYGKTVTIPVSNACDIFKWMGYIAVAFTMYAAARITMSGIST